MEFPGIESGKEKLMAYSAYLKEKVKKEKLAIVRMFISMRKSERVYCLWRNRNFAKTCDKKELLTKQRY